MGIAIHREAGLAAEQSVNRHGRPLAFDVPERLVQSTQGIIQHGAVSPIRTGVSSLPKILDVIGVSSATERVEILVDSRFDREGQVVQRSATQAIETGLTGVKSDHAK